MASGRPSQESLQVDSALDTNLGRRGPPGGVGPEVPLPPQRSVSNVRFGPDGRLRRWRDPDDVRRGGPSSPPLRPSRSQKARDRVSRRGSRPCKLRTHWRPDVVTRQHSARPASVASALGAGALAVALRAVAGAKVTFSTAVRADLPPTAPVTCGPRHRALLRSIGRPAAPSLMATRPSFGLAIAAMAIDPPVRPSLKLIISARPRRAGTDHTNRRMGFPIHEAGLVVTSISQGASRVVVGFEGNGRIHHVAGQSA